MKHKEPKIPLSIRLKQPTIDYVISYQEERNLNSVTAAVDMIINEHKAANMNTTEYVANRIIEKFENKYGNALTRIRLASNAADVNIQILMEIINSFAINNTFDIGEFISIDSMKAPILEEAEQKTKSKIAYYKQLKDNKKKGKDEKQ